MNKMYPTNGATNGFVNDKVEAALKNPAYVRSHLHLVIRRRNGEVSGVLTREILNVNVEMRVRLDMICEADQCSADAKVTQRLLDLTGISEVDAWEIAAKNTAAETLISTMGTLFSMEMDEDPMFWVCTTQSNIDGAAALATPTVFHNFCEEQAVEACAVLPSSRHELLLIPEKTQNTWTYDELAELVKSVNCSGIISDDIKLDNVVYRFDASTNSINIAATAM